MHYSNVLVAVDIGLEEAQRLVASATQLVDPDKLTVAHVICLDLEHYSRTDRLHGASIEEAYWCTSQHLEMLCTPLGIDALRQRVLEGGIVEELSHLAVSEECDLVIIGRHQGTPPGSTTLGVASRVGCDVLAIAVD